MSLSIEIRQMDRIVILELAGRLSVLESGLKQTAAELIDRGERNFIVNLANVAYLDNFGLRQLCWLYTVARNRGGDMKLLKPTSRIKELLRITKLDTVSRRSRRKPMRSVRRRSSQHLSQHERERILRIHLQQLVERLGRRSFLPPVEKLRGGAI